MHGDHGARDESEKIHASIFIHFGFPTIRWEFVGAVGSLDRQPAPPNRVKGTSYSNGRNFYRRKPCPNVHDVERIGGSSRVASEKNQTSPGWRSNQRETPDGDLQNRSRNRSRLQRPTTNNLWKPLVLPSSASVAPAAQ